MVSNFFIWCLAINWNCRLFLASFCRPNIWSVVLEQNGVFTRLKHVLLIMRNLIMRKHSLSSFLKQQSFCINAWCWLAFSKQSKFLIFLWKNFVIRICYKVILNCHIIICAHGLIATHGRNGNTLNADCRRPASSNWMMFVWELWGIPIILLIQGQNAAIPQSLLRYFRNILHLLFRSFIEWFYSIMSKLLTWLCLIHGLKHLLLMIDVLCKMLIMVTVL